MKGTLMQEKRNQNTVHVPMKMELFVIINAHANALSFVEVKNLVCFLNNYAETHAILLPGRIPG